MPNQQFRSHYGHNKMKKILLLSLSTLLLTACADRNEYEKAVTEQMEKESEVKDYKIVPEDIAKCVVEKSSKKMHGVFPLDPTRLLAYRNYTKKLTLANSADPKKTLDELRTDFGSAKDLAEAHTNYTESLMECYSIVIAESESAAKEKK